MKRSVLLVLAVVLTLAGCGSGGQSAPSGGTRTVVDMIGRQVQIPADVTRIATDYPALNATLLVLGGADRVVATSPGVGPLFSTLVPTYRAVPQPFDSGLSRVNEEQLLGARPQVVLAAPAVRPLLPTFDRLGIPVVIFASFQTPEQLKAGVDLMAQIVGGGAPARAAEFGRYYDGNVARVASRIGTLPDAQRLTAYYTAGDPTQTEGRGSIVDIWMGQGGARNIAALNGVDSTSSGFQSVPLENVLRWNPDVVVCRDPPTRGQILADPRWAGVTAVRTGRVFVNPSGVYVWSVRSAESALQPLWAAKTFHPELFGDLDMAAEVKRFYAQFYSYELSDQQVASILDRTAS